MSAKLFLYASMLLVTGFLATGAAAIAAEVTPAKAAVTQLAAKAHEATARSNAAKSKDTKAEADAKTLAGMSILGNQEAPKALVIVPWKSSQLGDTLGIAKTLDDSRQPVDKDVFMRELSYYEIRSGSK